MLKTTEAHQARHTTYSKKLKTMLRRTATKIKKRGLINRVNIAVFIVLFAGIGGYFVINSFAATSTTDTANLWIIHDGSGSSGTCTRSDPAVTLSAAISANTTCSYTQNTQIFQLAASKAQTNSPNGGDIIRVQKGTYSGQTVTAVKASPGITFIGEDKSTTNLSSISIGTPCGSSTCWTTGGGAWLKFQDLHVTGTIGWEDVGLGFPHDITLTNVDAVDGGFWDGGKNITWHGGKLGPGIWSCSGTPPRYAPCHAAGWLFMQGSPPSFYSGTNILDNVILDGLVFDNIKLDHTCTDLPRVNQSGVQDNDPCHTEVIRLDEGTANVTIKNSKFTNDTPNSALILTGSASGGSASHTGIASVNGLTLENNYFGSATQPGLDAANGCKDYNIRYNTWESTMSLYDCTASTTKVTLTGNLGSGNCTRAPANSVTARYNVWSGTSSCGGTNNLNNQTMSFANDGFGYHILSDNHQGDPADCPATDIDGDTRPQGLGCDAGADEFKSTTSGGTPVLWVDADGGNCSRSVNYATGTACTWPAAYNAANAGEVINVKGGTYNDVLMPTNDGTAMTFKAVSGESIVLSGLDWRASPTGLSKDNHGPDNVSVIGPMKIGPTSIDGVVNTTFDNIDFDGGGGTSRAVQGDMPNTVPSTGANLTIKNSKLHNTVEANSMVYFSGAKLVFENNEFYDALIGSTSSKTHTECLYLWATSKITLSRNHFWDCDAEDVFITGSSTWPDAIVENNVFEIVAGSEANASSGLAFRNGGAPSPYPTNILLRYNTFMSGVQTPDSTSGSTGASYGNYFRLTPLVGWGSIVDGCNVTSSGPTSGCSNTNASSFTPSLINAGFTNPITTQANGTSTNKAPKGDYTLKSTSPFIDLVSDPATYPATDFLGLIRYKGSRPDLGAYEYQSGTTPTCTKSGDINCDNAVNVTDLSILLSNYGKTTAQLTSSTPSYPRADINTSGKVDIADLSALLTGYGK